MHKKMSLFRRKKSSKVFPVKISTMDAELEFSLDYKVVNTQGSSCFCKIVLILARCCVQCSGSRILCLFDPVIRDPG
jgi:hypothetical protein